MKSFAKENSIIDHQVRMGSPMPDGWRLNMGLKAGLQSQEFGTDFVTAVREAFQMQDEDAPSHQEIEWIADATDEYLDRLYSFLRENPNVPLDS